MTYYTKPTKLEYYSKEGDNNGVWYGKLKNDITLSSKNVCHEEFVMLSQGLSPKGRKLLKVASENHRIGDDLTFSLIKSASVLFAGADQSTKQIIEKCHDDAVNTVLDYIQKNLIFVREQSEEKNKYKKVNADKCLIAKFTHFLTRLGDASIHSHAILFNLAKNKQGKFKTIETKPLKQHVKGLGAMYRNEVAHLLNKRLGVEITPDRDYFTLPMVPNELIEKFSKRSKQITDSLLKNMIAMSPKARQIAALQTRQKKEPIHLEKKFEVWKTEMDGWIPEFPNNKEISKTIKELSDYREELLNVLVEKQSVFRDADLMEAVHIRAQWHGLGAKTANKYIKELLLDKEIKKLYHPVLGQCYTTQNQFDLEKQFYEKAIQYANKYSSKFNCLKDKIKYKERLNTEQNTVFEGIIKGSQLSLVNGKPGTGKSYLMGSVRQYYEDQKAHVLGCAPSGKAAIELQQGAGIKSSTIDSLLFAIEEKRIKLNSDTVLVCDETGMVGIRKLSKLLSYVEAANSKLIIVGDFQQLQAVEAGNSFYNLIKKIGTFELNDIQRQKEQVDRDNIDKIAAGKMHDVLDNLHERGLLHVERSNISCKAKLIDDWYITFNQNQEESVILATTKSNVYQLNMLAREKMLQNSKLLGLPAIFKNQDEQRLSLQAGERVMFRKNSYQIGVQNGLTGTVTQVNQINSDNVNVKVKLHDGRLISFNSEFYNSIDYGYAATVHKSQGMTVDNAYIFMSDDFINKNLSYVQNSRSRNPPKLYAAYEYEQENAYIKAIADKSNKSSYKHQLDEVVEV
jgi:Ti-type conjugative transfer relaxase TraA